MVKGELQSLKFHGMHILSQQVLPMAIPNVLHPLAHVGIIRLSIVFQKVCSKEVNPYEIAWLKQYVADTLCILKY